MQEIVNLQKQYLPSPPTLEEKKRNINYEHVNHSD